MIPIAGSCQELEYLKGDPRPTLQDGICVWFGHPCFVPLVSTDLDLSDFYVANGNYRPEGFEMLSYITDERVLGNAAGYVHPPTELPASETTALGALDLHGLTFTNLPPAIPDYVSRATLESELLSVLTNDRHPIVSLIGRGGVGKTSLALEVLHRVTESERFMAILWFSSRDIDLLPEGPKLVRPDVLTDKDLAEQLVRLLDPMEQDHTGFDPIGYFARALTRFEAGPVLFVFDNFETVRSPSDLYGWLDVNIRLPNKILVTTRLRDFKADYPVEVGGMQESEFRQLVESTAIRLGIASVVTPEYVAELYEEADGHPYVGKVMLGEVATAGRLVRVERVMAGREDVLEALFERTFAQLTPVAQRIFLTLSSWRSNVPRLALEAALLRPENERMDVEEGISALRRSSLVDSRISDEDDQEFLSVPLAAGVFGRRKLAVSPMATAIKADAELLQLIGAGGHVDIQQGIAPRVNRLFRAVARMAETDGRAVEGYLPVLEYIARGYSPAWLLLSDLVLEIRGLDAQTQAEAYLRRYLEANPTDWRVWVRLAKSCAERGEFAGELSAYVQGSRQPSVPYYIVSTAANRVNQLLADGRLGTAMDADERRIVIRDLLEALEERLSQADGTDYSRIAWLFMNIGDRNQARRYAESGLEIHPANTHLLGLARKLGN